jgi:predicted TIM-barrel fold metal-dependent hydrolase
MSLTLPDILVKDYKPRSLLRRPDNTPPRARFPVVDVHNHLFGELPPEDMLKVMDEVGVRTFVNLSGNVTVPFDDQGYTLRRRDFAIFADGYLKGYPTRFAAFTMSDFAQWGDDVLIKDADFTARAIEHFEADVALGARGLKVTKELGLRFKDAGGAMIAVDDERLSPIWQRAGELGLPVLIHTSDPFAFFIPLDQTNEHYPTLQEFPGWAFQNSHFGKWELLEQRDRMIARHPHTTFMLPHVANNPEDLDSVGTLLDRFSNVYIDISARVDELGRQPYTARDFFVRYQDRILFGIDMPISPEAYRGYFRFLETKDEYFDYPDYLGRPGHCRWRIYGIYLPDDVLRKVYYENAQRVIPGLG